MDLHIIDDTVDVAPPAVAVGAVVSSWKQVAARTGDTIPRWNRNGSLDRRHSAARRSRGSSMTSLTYAGGT